MHYRPMTGPRFLLPVLFAVFGVIGIALAFITLRGDGPPVVFTAFWIGALAWNAYWFLFRFAIELTLTDDDVIRSTSPLRTRRATLGQLVAIRPMRSGSNVAVFEIADQRPMLVFAAKGIDDFVRQIAARRPGLPVRLGWQARLSERLPGPSRTKRP